MDKNPPVTSSQPPSTWGDCMLWAAAEYGQRLSATCVEPVAQASSGPSKARWYLEPSNGLRRGTLCFWKTFLTHDHLKSKEIQDVFQIV